jgi:hypothetical protein
LPNSSRALCRRRFFSVSLVYETGPGPESTPSGGLRIGALMRNTDLAYHPLVEERYPVLASALRDGLSANGKKFAAKYAAEFNVPGLAYGSVLDNRERSHCRPLYDSRIMFNGQPIALVVAETSEIAHSMPAEIENHRTRWDTTQTICHYRFRQRR